MKKNHNPEFHNPKFHNPKFHNPEFHNLARIIIKKKILLIGRLVLKGILVPKDSYPGETMAVIINVQNELLG